MWCIALVRKPVSRSECARIRKTKLIRVPHQVGVRILNMFEHNTEDIVKIPSLCTTVARSTQTTYLVVMTF